MSHPGSKKFLPFSIRRAMAINRIRLAIRAGKTHGSRLLMRLLIRHFFILRNEPQITQELYLQIIARSERIWKQFLTDQHQKNFFGKALAKHNNKVKWDFLSAGINWDSWDSYRETVQREADNFEKIKDKEEKWRELVSACDALARCVQNTPFAGSIRKDIIDIHKRKSDIFSGRSLGSENDVLKRIFPKYFASVSHCKRKGVIIYAPAEYDRRMGDVWAIISQFIGKPDHRRFSVQLWKRTQLDVFQGNLSACCIAIGLRNTYPAVKLPGVSCRKYPAGILNYITDLGIQVAEVVDETSKSVIGQCWLFISLDELGNPVLVADSFDLRREYAVSKSWNSAIKDCMFDFLRQYAEASRIGKIVIGYKGPVLSNGKTHKIHNAVRIDDLKDCAFPKKITKLGSYFLNRPYFLESCGGAVAKLVYDSGNNIAAETQESSINLCFGISED